jgi:PAS domain S-box-containing protein
VTAGPSTGGSNPPSEIASDAVGAHRRVPLSGYFVALLALFAITAAAAVYYVDVQADRDARRAAEQDSSGSARIAAGQLAQAIETMRATTSQVAGNPQVRQVFATPKLCSLSFGLSDFGDAHLDLIRPDGSVVCSSAQSAGRPVDYRGESWLRSATRGSVLLAPVTDKASGQTVVISAVPIPGGGVVAAFAGIEPLAGKLLSLYGGGNPLEFLITSSDGSTVLSRSVDPGRWVGSSLDGTTFGATDSGQGERRDLDGRPRFYKRVDVAGAGWRLYAGEDKAAALASASTLRNRELAIILGGLVVLVLAMLAIYRRVALPIKRLGQAVASSSPGTSSAGVPVSGPAEVAALAGQVNGLISSVHHELGERRRAEDAAKRSEQHYRLLFESSPSPMCVCDAKTFAVLEINDSAVAHYGYQRDELLAMSITDLSAPDERATLSTVLTESTPTDRLGPLHQITKDGNEIEVRISSNPIWFGDREARFLLMEDVGERERFERQMRQSQRLESLGQLAGGVAHDFNNLLGVIMGYTHFAKKRITEATQHSGGETWPDLLNDVEQIDDATQRAAGLTRQLLAFARREVVQPTVLDVNDVVADLDPLLRRTLGEHVELTTTLTGDLWQIEIDKGQLEQVLVNLSVNARDAMPDGGGLTIDTANIDVDAHYAASRPALTTGRYVRVRVSDTGTGMDERTLQRAFEPFFTTKSPGSGTGLGLATVYGIITQAGGRAQIYSEPGIGTTFTALFPITSASAVEATAAEDVERPGGHETVLVVEDEDAIREVTEKMLTLNGYKVLTAADGPQALELATHHLGDIDLLVSDVVMPRMLGREVADRMRELKPELRVLYISGYAQPVLGAQGRLDPGVELLEKPFSEPALLIKVRHVLGDDSTATTG